MTNAIAIFVKTTALSPVKTRLASTIGVEKAHEFYQLSIDAMTSLLHDLQRSDKSWQGYFAVAENGAESHWTGLPTLSQGDGELGDRLHFVCHALLQTHSKVFLVGADSPQMGTIHLTEALSALDNNDCVMIPAYDGGFTLLGSKRMIPRDVWQGVEYSTSRTGSDLVESLLKSFKVKILAPMTDVDLEDDFAKLRVELANSPQLTESQKKLKLWLDGNAH